MIIAIRLIGGLLLLLGAASLGGMFVVEASDFVSPIAVALRYILMCIAGVGFLFAYKWAITMYATSLAINWVAFFVVYDGQSVSPIWATLPIPIVIAVLTYLAWDKLKPTAASSQVADDA